MTYAIASQCISCASVVSPSLSRCAAACPTGAIQKVGQRYQIDADRCNDCVGYYTAPQCRTVCPTSSSCVKTSNDYWENWFLSYDRRIQRMQAAQKGDYWLRWFDAYSTSLTRLLRSLDQPLETLPVRS